MGTVHMAPYATFAQGIAGHFECLFSSACTNEDLQYQRVGGITLDLDRTELDWASTKSHCCILELDERSQADQSTAFSGAPSASSFPPVHAVVSGAHPNSLLKRGRGRVGMLSSNCSQGGCTTGAVGCCSGQKLTSGCTEETPEGLRLQELTDTRTARRASPVARARRDRR